MFENVLFSFINILILKTGMSAIAALSSFIRLQHLLYFWMKLHFIIQQFLLVWGVRLGFVLRRRVPSLTTDTHTTDC